MIQFGKVKKIHDCTTAEVELGVGGIVYATILTQGGFDAVTLQCVPQVGQQVCLLLEGDEAVILGCVPKSSDKAPSKDSNQIILKSTDILLGAVEGISPVTRADKVVETLNSIIQAFNSHTHSCTLTVSGACPAGTVTGTASGTSSAPSSITSITVDDVKCDTTKVK